MSHWQWGRWNGQGMTSVQFASTWLVFLWSTCWMFMGCSFLFQKQKKQKPRLVHSWWTGLCTSVCWKEKKCSSHFPILPKKAERVKWLKSCVCKWTDCENWQNTGGGAGIDWDSPSPNPVHVCCFHLLILYCMLDRIKMEDRKCYKTQSWLPKKLFCARAFEDRVCGKTEPLPPCGGMMLVCNSAKSMSKNSAIILIVRLPLNAERLRSIKASFDRGLNCSSSHLTKSTSFPYCFSKTWRGHTTRGILTNHFS